MQNIPIPAHGADPVRSSELQPLPAPFGRLIDNALSVAAPEDVVIRAVDGDPDALTALGRSIAAQEGYLIEATVVAIARQHSERLVVEDMRLPIAEGALALVNSHDPAQYETLSLASDGHSMQTYHPDLVVVDRTRRTGLVVDIKRNLGGYGGSGKLAELHARMSAAALSLPDRLWRDHKRIHIERVGVAVIDASRSETDRARGLWCLADLDELLEVDGGGDIARRTIALFRTKLRTLWLSHVRHAATKDLTSPTVKFAVSDETMPPAPHLPEKRKRGRPKKILSAPMIVELFRPGHDPVH